VWRRKLRNKQTRILYAARPMPQRIINLIQSQRKILPPRTVKSSLMTVSHLINSFSPLLVIQSSSVFLKLILRTITLRRISTTFIVGTFQLGKFLICGHQFLAKLVVYLHKIIKCLVMGYLVFSLYVPKLVLLFYLHSPKFIQCVREFWTQLVL